MIAPAWLWVVFTIAGATGQSLRNAAQRSLTDTLGTVGATHIRFLFGLPFGLAALAVLVALGSRIPTPNAVSLAWCIFGAVAQIVATALMLAAMQQRSFVVTTAYTKTEPVQVAVFSVVFLGEHISALVASAIVVSTVGVIVLSWPSRSGGEIFSWRPAILGVVSGAFFALAAVAFRGAIVALDSPDFVVAATLTLAITLACQTVALTAWLLLRDPAVMRAILKAWRGSLAAGFLGSFASEMWFLAFALKTPASVRTLGLVEIIIAGLISRRLFAQTPSVRDVIAMVLIFAGIIALVAF